MQQLVIDKRVFGRIKQFYYNAMLKYPNTYYPDDADRDTDKVYEELYKAGSNKLWNKTDMNNVRGWENYNIDYSDKTGWYFAYKIENNVIYIEDAENHRNMTEQAFKLK